MVHGNIKNLLIKIYRSSFNKYHKREFHLVPISQALPRKLREEAETQFGFIATIFLFILFHCHNISFTKALICLT